MFAASVQRARSTAVLAAMALIAAAPPALAAGEEPDLLGTWYVLIHYTDADAAHPERVRWDDKLWVFEKKGSRLKWTEYPIVVFTNREGRFETSAHGQTRVMHAWEPNSSQRAQIKAGLEFNTRGSKSKQLRKKKSGGYKSSGPPQATSASVVGYHESWAIEIEDGVPTFIRDDVLGSQRAETMSGRTLYAGETISAAGGIIRGKFARDESRRGTFKMVRSGDASSVGTKKSISERMRDSLRQDGENMDIDDAEGWE